MLLRVAGNEPDLEQDQPKEIRFTSPGEGLLASIVFPFLAILLDYVMLAQCSWLTVALGIYRAISTDTQRC